MRKIVPVLSLVILALGGIAIWQFSGGAHAESLNPNSEYSTSVGISIPVAATATSMAKPVYEIPLTPDPRDRVIPAEPPITPRPPAGAAAIVPAHPDASLGQPTFDAAAASAYVLADQPWRFTFPTNGQVVVASVEFLTGQQMNERQVTRGYQHPDDRLLCLVTLSGEFTYPAPLPGSAGQLGQPSHLTAIYVLYDARTGNYVGIGGIR